MVTVGLVASSCVIDGCSSSTGESGKNSAITLNDAFITAGVETALERDSRVQASHIKVRTENGQVQLSGRVNTPEQQTIAEQDALKVQDVRSVLNNLTVQEAAGADAQ